MQKIKHTKKIQYGLLIFALLISSAAPTEACTNFLITPSASKENTPMLTYTADSHVLYGELYFYPRGTYPEGTMLDVHEWDSRKFLGQIPQVPQTYQVVGNMNEFGLTLAETTFGGRSELQGQKGLLDYGSLIYITLQRAKTAREAIRLIESLTATYGYYSSGECFSIADTKEVWYMELIGKGPGEKGILWVARRVPDGYVSAHANAPRITTFPQNAPDECLYSDDVIAFAKERGWFKGKNQDFSFADVYGGLDFGSARFCDARVWSFFRRIADSMEQYEEYAQGKIQRDITTGYWTNRLPLWIKPKNKLSVKQVMDLLRDHYEGTSLDMTKDVGAGAHGLPYRYRPLTWKIDSVTYCNERAISTQQTGFSFVSQARDDMPKAFRGILWFGVDDTYTTCYTPIYSGVTRVPQCFAVGNGSLLEFSWESAFWVFNLVNNFAYLRWDRMSEEIRKVQHEIETQAVVTTQATDKALEVLWKQEKQKEAIEYLTTYCEQQAQSMFQRWQQLATYLIVRYSDGNIMKVDKEGNFQTNGNNYPVAPEQPGYSESFYRNIIKESGDHFLVPKKK